MSLPRLRGAVLVAGLVAVALVGCAPAATPTPAPSSTPTPQPTADAVVGKSALPLGCADLLTTADLAGLVEVKIVVDETHLVQSAEEAARAQAGQLLCGWGDAEFRGTGWSDQLELRILPTADTSIPESDDSGDRLVPVEAAVPTSVGRCSSDGAHASCRMIQLRDGYRVELQLSAMSPSDDTIRASAETLLGTIGAAVDSAGPQRVVAQPDGVARPASLCAEPDIRTVVDARGAAGEPTVTSTSFDEATLVTCTWTVDDPWSGTPSPITVSVLPGGAWAMPSLADGVGVYPLWYEPSPSGAYLVGSGDWLGALRVRGADLVALGAPQGPDDPGAWELQLDAAW